MQKRLCFCEGFAFQGSWWLPQDDKQKLRGELCYSPHKGVSLTLEGLLGNRPLNSDDFKEFSKLYGLLDNGLPCTLLNAFETSIVTQLNTTSKLTVNCAIIGHYAIKGLAETYDEVHADFDHFSSWRGAYGFFKQNLDRVNSAKQSSITYTRPKDEEFFVTKDGLTISFTSTFHGNHGRLQRTLSHEDWVKFTFNHGRTVSFILRKLYEFEGLLSFLTVESTRIRWIELVKKQAAYVKGQFPSNRIYLVVNFSYIRENVCEKSWPDFPFNFANIAKIFPSVLSKWSANSRKLDAAHDLFFHILNNSQMSPETAFLSLTQSLEAFSRTFRRGNYLHIEDYDKVKGAIIGAIPTHLEKSHRDALANRIKYGYQWSLRKRLSDLIGLFSLDTQTALGFNEKNFIAKVVDTRNYLTHLDKTIRKNSLKGVPLIKANKILQSLFLMLIYLKIGIPESLILQATGHRKFKKQSF